MRLYGKAASRRTVVLRGARATSLMTQLSVVIPAFNEEAQIVPDDRGGPRQARVARRRVGRSWWSTTPVPMTPFGGSNSLLADHRVRLLRNGRNFGKGYGAARDARRKRGSSGCCATPIATVAGVARADAGAGLVGRRGRGIAERRRRGGYRVPTAAPARGQHRVHPAVPVVDVRAAERRVLRVQAVHRRGGRGRVPRRHDRWLGVRRRGPGAVPGRGPPSRAMRDRVAQPPAVATIDPTHDRPGVARSAPCARASPKPVDQPE